jgi:hypothetical protein
VCLLVCLLLSYRDPQKKQKKIISSAVLKPLEPQIFVSVTLLSLCPSWLSLIAI